MDQQHGSAYADRATQQRKKCPLQKKLKQDVSVGRAQGFAQADLACTFGDCDQHDVDDPNRAECQRYQTYAAEEPIHRGENFSHGLLILHRVPFFPDIFVIWVEAPMIPGHDAVKFSFGGFVILCFDSVGLVANDSRKYDVRARYEALRGETLPHGIVAARSR